MRSLNNDIKYGMLKEEEVLPTLKNNWTTETNIRNTKDIYNNEYHPYDYESEEGSTWELKSRRTTKNKYPTTILPCHKVRNTTKPQYFVFNFTDACCMIEYNEELFKTFKTRMIGVNREGASYRPIKHYEIPITHLKDLIRVYAYGDSGSGEDNEDGGL